VPRKQSPTLTDAELRIMEVLWEHGPSTVRDVLRHTRRRPKLAYGSVATVIRILEEKQYVRHRKEGRAFVFEAIVAPDEARGEAVDFVVSRYYRNSRKLLALNLLEEQGLDERELTRLRKLIADDDSDE
jgi:predicted transcriptional regulator